MGLMCGLPHVRAAVSGLRVAGQHNQQHIRTRRCRKKQTVMPFFLIFPTVFAGNGEKKRRRDKVRDPNSGFHDASTAAERKGHPGQRDAGRGTLSAAGPGRILESQSQKP